MPPVFGVQDLNILIVECVTRGIEVGEDGRVILVAITGFAVLVETCLQYLLRLSNICAVAVISGALEAIYYIRAFVSRGFVTIPNMWLDCQNA